MKHLLGIFCCCLLLFATVQAQDGYKKINNALRYLKLGNTLREAQQYDLSEQYLRKGLQLVTAQGDKYWEAAMYENLGMLYKDQDNLTEAARYFNRSITIYKQLKMSLSQKAVEQLLNSAEGVAQAYAGIEITTKGVKMSIVAVELNSSNEVEYVLRADTSVNPEPGAITAQSNQETADAIKFFLEAAKTKYGIAGSNIYVVMASSFKAELDKKNKLAEFISAVTPANAPAGFSIKFVTPAEESELSVLGTVPPKRRYTTSLIDIGSGSTKGGYFMDATETFDPLVLNVGTKSFVKIIKDKNPAGIADFAGKAALLWRDSLQQTARTELGRRAGLKNRGSVYVSGGIVWCMVSYLYPEKAMDNYIEITPEDVRRFKNMAAQNFGALIQPGMAHIINDNTLKQARINVSRAQNTFDQESIIAGAIWLDGLITELNSTQPQKRFYFPRYGYVGWISGYIARAVAADYRKKNEN
ncbi:MAG: hypothetical protein EAZ16_06335 [Sphingobacteriales bacterium]|nr:MAG: hypothetical protein EAZ16_06335 [Sphingobacteriales bacterium]